MTNTWGNLVFMKKDSVIKWIVFICILILLLIAFLCTRKKPEKKEVPVNKRIQEINAVIHEQYRDFNLTLEKIAHIVGLNKVYLGNFYKKETGQNLMDYIHQIRIDKAKNNLKQKGTPVSEVGFEVGYNTVQSFNQNFKKFTGKTPSDYRKEIL
jgi:two-component system response regulator YesN